MHPHYLPIAEDKGKSPGNGITPNLLSQEPLMMEEEFYGKSREEIDQEFAPGGEFDRPEESDEPTELPFFEEPTEQRVGFGKPPAMNNETPLGMDFSLDPTMPDF